MSSSATDELVRPFQCPECGSRYTRQEHLSRHQQARHSTVKDFVCTICNKGFARRDILRRHELGHYKSGSGGAPGPGSVKSDNGSTRASSPKPSTKTSTSASTRVKRESVPSAKKRAAALLVDEDENENENENEKGPTTSMAAGPPMKKFQKGRICDACLRAKTKCDGQDPCNKCRKTGNECGYDSLTKDSIRSQSPPESDLSDDLLSDSASLRDDDDSPDVESPHSMRNPLAALSGAAGMSSPHHESPQPHWGHPAVVGAPGQTPSAQFGSPYSVPIRPPSAHQSHHGALPPSSFQQAPSPLGFGAHQHYYARPPDSFLHRPQPSHLYGAPPPNLNGPPSPYLTHFGQQQAAPVQTQLPNASVAAQQQQLPSSPVLASASSPFDTAAYGRASTSNVNGGHAGNELGSGHADFLDLITGASGETEIDWNILNSSGFAAGANANMTTNATGQPSTSNTTMATAGSNSTQGEGYSAVRGNDIVNGASAGASYANTRAAGSPGTVELEARLLGNSIQAQHSNLREAQSDDLLPLLALPFTEPGDAEVLNGAATGGAGNTNESTPSNASSGAFNSGLSAPQNSAAETLLQLASHTPRQSPEPESRFGANSASSLLSHLRNTPPPSGLSSQLVPEEETRSSHLAHSSNDPWPLSYRPSQATEDLLPASARGTGYRSRAASPRPGTIAARPTPQVVPAVTNATRLRVLAKVRSIGSQERFVPRLELLDLFLQSYFTHFHHNLPLLHRPTFDPNTCPSFLLLAVASVGARYAHERLLGADVWAQALLETARKMVQIVGDADNRLLQTVAWQQSLIIILLTGYVSGNKRDLERTQGSGSMPITYARRQGWFKEPKIDETTERSYSLEERWKRWRDREEIKRLGFGALIFDSMGTSMWDRECSSLFVDAAKAGLPCHDNAWDAKNALEWQVACRGGTLPPRSLETLEAVKLICNRSTHNDEALLAIAPDVFAMQVILSIVHSLGWAVQHDQHILSMFLPFTPSPSPFADAPLLEAIETGFEFFQNRKVLDFRASHQHSWRMTSGTNNNDSAFTLMVHLMAMTQRLPLRILHPLARTGDSKPSSEILEAVHTWFTSSRGQTARLTAYHAGQLFSTPSPIDSPWEPFALFYAALTLVAYTREANEAQDGGANALLMSELELKRPFVLDKPRALNDSELLEWIHSDGEIALVPHLEVIGGSLWEPGAIDKVLKIAATTLTAMKVYKVGELLAKTLTELSERGNRSERGGSLNPNES